MFKCNIEYFKKNKYIIIGFLLVFLSIVTDVYSRDNSIPRVFARIILLITGVYGFGYLLLAIIDSKKDKWND